jgi:hypothetical protein
VALMCKTTTVTDVFDENENLITRTTEVEEICCSDECLCKGAHKYTGPIAWDGQTKPAEPKYSDDGGSVVLKEECTRKHVDDMPLTIPCDRKHLDQYYPGYWPGPFVTTTGTKLGESEYTFTINKCSHSKPTKGCSCEGHR